MWSAIIASNRLRGKAIEIIQSRVYSSETVVSGGTLNLSFLTVPQSGSKILIYIHCDQARISEIVGETEIVGIGGSNPARVFESTNISNSYIFQNTSTQNGVFRIVMVEFKNYTTVNYIGTDLQSGVTNINSTSTNVNKGEMLLVFYNKSANEAISATNSFLLIEQGLRTGAYQRLYTSNEINQLTNLSSATSATFRQVTLKLIP
jgi:hypothetical protein